MRLTHVQSFGRFDEMRSLVEKTSDLTLPDSVRCGILSQCGPQLRATCLGKPSGRKPSRAAASNCLLSMFGVQ